jgi:hypothetical protein
MIPVRITPSYFSRTNLNFTLPPKSRSPSPRLSVRRYEPDAQPTSGSNTPCRLSANVYSFSSTCHLLRSFLPFARWGRFMPWWQGTHLICIYGSTVHLLDHGCFINFVILYTVGRTPWTGGQPVARSLPTQRTKQTQNKRIHRHPRLDWDSNPWSQWSGRRQFMH